MEDESTEPKKFSYPNADRQTNDAGEITGPGIGAENRDKRNEQRHPTVHLVDALQDQPAPKVPSDMQSLKTFQSDVANVVHSDNVSLIKIALAEKKRQERQGTFDLAVEGPSAAKRGLIIGIIAIALLIIGGGIFIGLSVSKSNTPPIDQNANSTFTTPTFETESTVVIDVRGKDPIDIEKIVQTEKAAELSLGSMERVKFIETSDTGIAKDLTAEAWLNFLKVRAPGSLIRSFESGFIFGFYSLTPHDSFVILKVNSYDNAYAGMLAWEPDMENDIGGLIINKRLTKIGEDGPLVPEGQFDGKPFVDKVLSNKDTRVLFDDANKIKMLYSFVDQETLVIASGESVLREVIFRLTTGRISR